MNFFMFKIFGLTFVTIIIENNVFQRCYKCLTKYMIEHMEY